MNYNEILAAAKDQVGPYCKAGPVGNGKAGATTAKLRQTLNDIQWGLAEDKHGWLTSVGS